MAANSGARGQQSLTRPPYSTTLFNTCGAISRSEDRPDSVSADAVGLPMEWLAEFVGVANQAVTQRMLRL
jgi:hypothetical protein